jgi:hypothetical protein
VRSQAGAWERVEQRLRTAYDEHQVINDRPIDDFWSQFDIDSDDFADDLLAGAADWSV